MNTTFNHTHFAQSDIGREPTSECDDWHDFYSNADCDSLTRKSLTAALGILSSPSMQRERDFVVNPDPAVDIRRLTDVEALACSATVVARRMSLHNDSGNEASTDTPFDLLLVPSADMDRHTIGIVVMSTEVIPSREGETVRREKSMGRFCCFRKTGEILFVLKPFGSKAEVKDDALEQIYWVDGPKGRDRSQRRCASFLCDSNVFNQRDALASVLACEVSERMAIESCSDCVNAYVPSTVMGRKCLLHQQAIEPAQRQDVSSLQYTLSVHTGASIGHFMSWCSRGEDYTTSSMLTISVGKDEGCISVLLAKAYSEFLPTVATSTGFSEVPRSQTGEAHMCRGKSGNSNIDPAGTIHERQHDLDVTVFSVPSKRLKLNSALCNQLEPADEMPATLSEPSCALQSVSKQLDTGSNISLSAAERRRLSNRASAARSNQRRRETIAALRMEIEAANEALAAARARDHELRNENLRLRRQAAEGGCFVSLRAPHLPRGIFTDP